MKYKSMDDLRKLSDKEVEDFLKIYWKTDELTFYGIFEPNTKDADKYSGTMTRLRVPGSSVWLKYPFSDFGLVSMKIPANKKLDGKYYKFSCCVHPNYNNRCQLQILLNTLEEIDEGTYNVKPVHHESGPQSPLAYRFQLLEDEETGWGKGISQLLGVYKKRHDGSYYLDDIRKTDLTCLRTYPKTTFHVSPLPLKNPIEGLEEGQYCLFNWRFTFNVKVNPCDIEVDESKPIVFVNPKDLITELQKVDPSKFNDAPALPRQTDVCVLIYDLLHEANRYSGAPVDAQFYLTDKYLSFRHTGRPITAETILNLCGLGERNGQAQDNIMYHCRGLREFLSSNSRTIVVSNGFTVRFDNDNGKLNAVWLEKKDLPREIKISLARNKRFTETIILPFDKKTNTEQNNYKVGLHCVFEDVQNIAFFSNIGKVTVKIKGGKAKTLDRKDWIVSKEYKSFIPRESRLKLADKKETSIMFACRHKGNVLIGDDDSPVYSLIPTTSSFGFPFLMQLDVHVNKTNYTINHRDSWNKVYAEKAGRLFAQWITDLTHAAEFTPKSIYSIVPKFNECIEEHPEEQTFIKLFQFGFKSVILDDKNDKDNAKPKDKPRGKATGPSVADKPSKYSKPVRGKNTYVIDTNIFVNCPDIISKLKRSDNVILSAKVVDELDNLKYKMEDKDLRNVQMALKNINVAFDKPNVHMEMSDVSLLPRDFDRHNPDNNILSVVLRHKAENPILLTSDNGLQIKAKTLGINVIGLKEYLASRKRKKAE